MSYDPLRPKDGEMAVITNKDHEILFSDFEPEGTPSGSKLHLLDIFDSKNQDILRIVGVALDRVGQQVESDVTFRSEQYHVRVVYSGPEAGDRTHIFLKKGWTIRRG